MSDGVSSLSAIDRLHRNNLNFADVLPEWDLMVEDEEKGKELLTLPLMLLLLLTVILTESRKGLWAH